MDNSLIGEQITKFRKAAGLTQEDLGKAVGVSTQAVSRWECGGAPDVSLLPAIADKLGVTIDALFGREGGVPADIGEQFCRYVASLPEGRRLDAICRIIYQSIQYTMPSGILREPVTYSEKCTLEVGDRTALMRSGARLEEGLVFGIGSEELSFMSVYPEPEAGWAAYFADNDTYRELFSTLSRPNCLEILELLYSEEERYLVPEVAAARLGIPDEEAAELFALLSKTHLLSKLELELPSGKIPTYIINDNYQFVPFLLTARCLCTKETAYYVHWIDRKSPILRRPGDEKKKEKKS